MATTYPPVSSSSTSSAPLHPHHSLGRSSEDSFDSDQDVEASAYGRGLEAKEAPLYDDEDLYPEAEIAAATSAPYTAKTSATQSGSQARGHRRSSSAAVAGDPLSLDATSSGFRHDRSRAEMHRLMGKPGRIRSKEDFGKRAVVIGCLIASWYTFSTLISVYNKWMFDPKERNFPYPVFVTSLHMLAQFSIASSLILLLDRTGRLQLVPRTPEGRRRRPSGRDWISKVVPCALASALDIGLSNTSLKSISLTLYTMCKSSNLVFVLAFAFLFGLERIRWNLVGVITVITIGVIMMVAAETELVLIGAIQVLLASMMGGLRWALTQMLLEKEKLGMNNPVAAIFWLCPIMAVLLFFTGPMVEDWRAMWNSPELAGGFARTLKTFLLFLAPGVLAFCMSLSEYALIQRTSVVTLSVAGILKEILTVLIASSIFDDRLTPVNITGLCIAISGIAAYNYIKYKGLNDEDGGGVREGGTPGEGYERAATTEQEWERSGRVASGGREGFVDGEEGDPESSQVPFERPEDSVLPNAASSAFPKKGLRPGSHSGTGLEEGYSLSSSPAQHPLASMAQSEEEKRRERREEAARRKRREEADMDGWDNSGFQTSGNGLHYADGDDEEEDGGLDSRR